MPARPEVLVGRSVRGRFNEKRISTIADTVENLASMVEMDAMVEAEAR
jgi:hypothetical protein